MKSILLTPGDTLYAVEDMFPNDLLLKKAVIEDVMDKRVRFVDGDSLFNLTLISKHDPRMSSCPKTAIKAYITRKKRQIRDLKDRILERKEQLQKAKQLTGVVK